MTSNATVIRVARLDEIFALRHAILRPGRPLAAATFDGDDEPATVHVAAFDGPAVVGCATVIRRPLDGDEAAQLRGMATAPARMRQGVGTTVVRFAEALVARDWHLGLVWCNARTSAQGFYESAGWSVVSDVFEVPDVGPHVRMVRMLASVDFGDVRSTIGQIPTRRRT